MEPQAHQLAVGPSAVLPNGSGELRPLPEPLHALLAAAARAEKTARGSQRRVAFRITRHLLGGAHSLGFELTALAAAISSSVNSTRNRAIDGPITLYELTVLGVLPDTLQEVREELRAAPILASKLIPLLLSGLERRTALGKGPTAGAPLPGA